MLRDRFAAARAVCCGGRPLARARRLLAAYCESTTVHGLKYLTETRRPAHERLLWFLGLLLAAGACYQLISQAWENWRESPVIVAMDETQRPIWDIPFPAVTVCPETKVQRVMFNYSQAMQRYLQHNATDEERETLAVLSLQCDDTFSDIFSEPANGSIVEVIEQHSLRLSAVMAGTMFRGLDAQFRRLLTDEGVCWSFNMLPGARLFRNDTFQADSDYLDYSTDAPHWSPSEGYSRSAGPDAYPHRALGSGVSAGLVLYLNTHGRDLDYVCKTMSVGFKIHLHSPAEFPQPGQQAFLVPLNSAVQVAVTPHEMLTGPGLRRRYSVEQRQCYYPDERALRFFQQYTKENCELECLGNVTLALCGCVPFYMPRNLTTPVCASNKRDCISESLRIQQQQESHLQPTDSRGGELPTLADCHCLQGCTHIAYNTERSHADMDTDKFKQLFPQFFDDDEQDINLAKVTIYFKDSHFIPTRRMELFSVIDFIANCGGLLGLCLGVSVLSLVELLYWLLVRPFCRTAARK